MKAAVYHGVEDIRLEEVPVPEPGEGEALIKVHYCGICGSDLHIYHGKHSRAKPPLIIGHEFSGEIVGLGPDEGRQLVKIGDRVVVEPLLACGECYPCRIGTYNVCQQHGLIGIDVNGAFAEYVVAAVERIHQIPDGLPMDAAALAEPLAVGVHAARRSALKLGDTTVVLGGGPIGLLLAQVLKAAGAGQVIISEVSDYRLDIARRLGFTALDGKTVDVVLEVTNLTAGRGADLVFDAAGVPVTARQLGALTAIGGQIVIVAVFGGLTPIDLRRINHGELSLIGIREYDFRDFKEAIRLLAAGHVDAERMITQRLDLSQMQEAIEAARQATGTLKVLLKP